MPLTSSTNGYAPTAHRSTLWMLTCLGAIDGTVVMLAAGGRMNSLVAAVVVGLTVVSGAGAWIAARQAFGQHRHFRDYAVLGAMAATSIAATVAAAWLGATVGTAMTLHILPKAAGLVLFLVAAEVGGLKLPRLAGAPLPVVAVLGSLLVEVAWQWTP